jgi:hypothetical protein
MNVFGHNDICSNHEPITPAQMLKDLQEQITAIKALLNSGCLW